MTEYAEVRIRWAPVGENPSTTPKALRARGRYRPHFRLGADGEYLGVAFVDGSTEWSVPGAESSACVAFLYTETGVDYSALVPGACFQVVEGPYVIGSDE